MNEPSTGMVGRAGEQARLHAASTGAMGGTASFVLVLGEAGIGKSRLLRAMASDAAALGLRPLVGTAIETGGALPFLPLIAPLGVATRASEPGDAAMHTVRRLVRGADPTDSADAASAARLLESIHDVLVRRPTALILDDIQWADASTITVLDYLAHRATDVPLVVVVAARDDDPSILERLPIADGRRYARVRLERLSRDDVASQVAGLTGTRPDAGALERIYRRTDGNPFFVEQVIEAFDGPGGPDRLPPTLRMFVRRRVTQLAPAIREVLQVLAVVGRRSTAETVADVIREAGGTRPDVVSARPDPDGVAAALTEAVASGVAVADPDGIDLCHPLFREVLVEDLARSVLERLHGAAALVLERRGQPVTEVADHWWRSDDPTRAWASARAAADVAEAALAFPEARLHLDRAIARWPGAEPGRVDAMLRSARAAWLDGDAEGALATIVAAEAAAGAPTVELMTAKGEYAWDAGEREVAAQAFERTLDLTTPATSPSILATAYWGLGRGRVGAGRFDEAADLARTSEAIAVEAGDLTAQARARFLFAMSRALAGSLDGIPALTRGVELALASGTPVEVGHGHQFLVDLLSLDGRVDDALTAARRGIEASDRLGVARTHGADLRGRAGLALIELGRWDEAAETLRDAEPRAFPLLASAVLATRRGLDAEAAAALDAAATSGSMGGPGALGGWPELVTVERAWLAGDHDLARNVLAGIPPVAGVWGGDVRARAAAWSARLAVSADRAAYDRWAVVASEEPDPAVEAALVAEIGGGRPGRRPGRNRRHGRGGVGGRRRGVGARGPPVRPRLGPSSGGGVTLRRGRSRRRPHGDVRRRCDRRGAGRDATRPAGGRPGSPCPGGRGARSTSSRGIRAP